MSETIEYILRHNVEDDDSQTKYFASLEPQNPKKNYFFVVQRFLWDNGFQDSEIVICLARSRYAFKHLK